MDFLDSWLTKLLFVALACGGWLAGAYTAHRDDELFRRTAQVSCGPYGVAYVAASDGTVLCMSGSMRARKETK